MTLAAQLADIHSLLHTGILPMLIAAGASMAGSYLSGRSASKDAAKNAAAAKKQANREFDKGYADQQGYNEQAYDEFDPYASGGQQANDMYLDAIGANGPEAQQAIVDSQAYANPYRQFNEDASNRALSRQFNAYGGLMGGASAMASARANLERGSQDWNSMLDRWGAMGTQGQQIAQLRAGIRQGQGDDAWGYRASRAGAAVNAANAQTQTSNANAANTTGLIGQGLQAFGSIYGGRGVK